MKKLLFVISILCTVSGIAQAAACCCENECCEEECWAITLKNGYFYPQERALREIFDRRCSKGGYWFEAAARYRFWKGMNVEASGSYFKSKGNALVGQDCGICFNTCTEVKIPTLGLGLKYFFNFDDCFNECSDCCKRFSFFVGAGLRIFFYRERNSSPFVIQCVDKTTAGGMINAGVEIDLYKGLFIDIFIDYNIGKLKLDRKDLCKKICSPCCTPCTTTSSTACVSCCPSCCYNIHLGGMVAGVGLGYKF